ncbi:MAG: leucyl/phenylalanyl-tRNA--protein transferase [bacterium]
MRPRHKPDNATRRKRFPDPRTAGPDGLLAYSADIDAGLLLEAYQIGVFPWPQQDSPMLWFSPQERGILEFNDLHLSQSFRKFLKKTTLKLKINTAFKDVIIACAKQPRPGQDGTWITKEMIRAYREFHEQGFVHSIEAWQDETLVGGLYGVYVNSMFCGESMFHTRAGASKFCLYHVTRLLSAAGHTWMDIQMVTPLLESWGGKLITRDEYLERLVKASSASVTNPFEANSL